MSTCARPGCDHELEGQFREPICLQCWMEATRARFDAQRQAARDGASYDAEVAAGAAAYTRAIADAKGEPDAGE